ncbi:MAG: GNAT family N-acetyltransferase [Hyphomicrobiales bacterium]
MIIRELKDTDIDKVVDLWYNASIVAHDFIEKEFWQSGRIAMKDVYIPNSETYVGLVDDKIVGFVSMSDDFLAALFVDTELQGKGYGTQLLNYIKSIRSKIQLNVYKKNINSTAFYISQGFKQGSKSIDRLTGEHEYAMKWVK